MGDGYAATFQFVTIVSSMCLAAVVLLALTEIPALLRQRPLVMWLAGIFLLALMLRLLLPSVGLFHDHNHGYRYLEVMMSTGPHDYRLEYGLGGFGSFRLLLFFLPDSPQSVFALNILFGALTIFPVYAFARSVWASERAGLFAALAIALLPPHIRLSATEDLYVLGGLLEVTCLAAVLAYSRAASIKHLALAVASAVLVCQVRESLNLVPLFAIAAFFLFAAHRREALRRPSLWGAVAMTVLLVAPHAYFFASYSLPSLAAIGPRFDSAWVLGTGVRIFTLENPYLDPGLTLPTFALLGAAGVALRFRSQAGPILFVGSAVLVFAWVAFLKTITETDRVMFHAHYGIFLAVLVGRGVHRLLELRVAQRAPAVAAAAAAVALLAMPVAAWSFLTRESNIQLEFQCVSEQTQSLQQGCTLVTLTNGDDVGEEPIGVTFGYLPSLAAAEQRLSISEFTARAHSATADLASDCYLYYEQRICYEPSFDEVLRYCGLAREAFRYPELLDCVTRYRSAHHDAYQLSRQERARSRPAQPVATRPRSAPLRPSCRGNWMAPRKARIACGHSAWRPRSPQ